MNRAKVHWPGLVVLGVVSAVVAGCGSDDFGPTGSSLPIDVQGVLPVDPPLQLSATMEVSVTPDLAQPFDEREILYLGNRSEGGWRATPMLRFDFSSPPDTLDLSPENFKRTELQLKMLSKDAAKGIHRTLRLYALADTLTPSTAEADLGSTLGDEIEEIENVGDSNFALELPDSVVAAWIEGRGHTGIALYDLTADVDTLDSNLVGLAGKEFTRFGSLLDPEFSQETAIPEIVVELLAPIETFVAFPVILDLTHFQRDDHGDDLELAAHLPSRCWLTFDVANSLVPSNATVNQAMLRLFVDPTFTLAQYPVDVIGYRTGLDGADTGTPSSLEPILKATESFDPVTETQIEMNVTELVQRAVNGVLDEGDGVLLVLRNELLELTVLDFFGSSATDSLQPRLDITYTPPADFLE
jgi:hypothetical protein